MTHVLEIFAGFLDYLFLFSQFTRVMVVTRYGHYAGEVKDIIIGRLAVISQIVVPKIRAFSCGLMSYVKK